MHSFHKNIAFIYFSSIKVLTLFDIYFFLSVPVAWLFDVVFDELPNKIDKIIPAIKDQKPMESIILKYFPNLFLVISFPCITDSK